MDEQSNDAEPHCDSTEIDAEQDSNAKVLKTGKRPIGFLSIAMVLLFLLLGGAGAFWLVAREAQKMPESYQAVLEIEPKVAARDGSRLEYNLVRLQNAARKAFPGELNLLRNRSTAGLFQIYPRSFPIRFRTWSRIPEL